MRYLFCEARTRSDPLTGFGLFCHAFGVAPDHLEALRERVIRDYGTAYELMESPKKPKNKRSHSRNTQRKREIAAQAIRDYSTDDVLQTADDFIRAQNEE